MKEIIKQNLLSTKKAFYALFICCALFANTAIFAQKTAQTKPTTTAEPSPIEAKFYEEVGTLAQDFWSPKLNSYKNKIDRVLSANDLSELNKLRARWGVLFGQLSKKATVNSGLNNTKKSEQDVELDIEDGDFGSLLEIFDIFNSAKNIAKKYRPGLDKVGETVLTDVGNFAGDVANTMESFSSRNAAMIKNDESMPTKDDLNSGVKDLRKFSASMKETETREDIMQVYNTAFEPIIMLFSGNELSEIFSSLGHSLGNSGVLTKPVTGIAIPEGAVLKQNYPNPASKLTTIKYRLPDNSNSVTLKIYNATGAEVITMDEGSKTQGEHEIKVDVSSLTSGSYLYQLKISTQDGDQVFAKTMQVVK